MWRPSSNASARGRLDRIDSLYGYAFIAPAVIGFILFVAVPIVGVFVFSFQDYNSLSGRSSFVGFDNYEEIAVSGTFRQGAEQHRDLLGGRHPREHHPRPLARVTREPALPLASPIFRTAYFVPGRHLARRVVARVGGPSAGPGRHQRVARDDRHRRARTGSRQGRRAGTVIAVQVLKGVGVSMILFLAALQEVPVGTGRGVPDRRRETRGRHSATSWAR